MALLDHRNTSTQGHNTSPAQRCFGRRTRTLLPTTSNLLMQQNNNHQLTKDAIQQQQNRQQGYFNRHAHDHPILEEGESVRIQPFVNNKKVWRKGTVLRKLDSRSYEIEADNTIYRRNRVHLKNLKVNEPDTPEPVNVTQPELPSNMEVVTPPPPSPVSPAQPAELRRSTREIRKPQRLIES